MKVPSGSGARASGTDLSGDRVVRNAAVARVVVPRTCKLRDRAEGERGTCRMGADAGTVLLNR